MRDIQYKVASFLGEEGEMDSSTCFWSFYLPPEAVLK